MILLIDNYDSFTWNLVQRLGELDPSLEPGRGLIVVRNDKITPDEAAALNHSRGPDKLIISPGPCTPAEAGVSGDMIARFAGKIPILGVCLGHQCIGAVSGMTVARHHIPVHGKTSLVHHDGKGLFAGLPDPFEAARYHSLVVLPESIPGAGSDRGPTRNAGFENRPSAGSESRPDPGRPDPGRPDRDGWEVSAWSEEPGPDGRPVRVVMGLRRVWADPTRAPLEGVQFHPESFLTAEGPRLLANFLGIPAPQTPAA